MRTCNSELLRHEADHYDDLIKRFPDLTLEFSSDTSYYYSDLTIPLINQVKINRDTTPDNFIGMHDAIFYYKIEDCLKCKAFDGTADFVINNRLDPINICYVDSTLTGLEYSITTFSYADALEELKIAPSIIKECDLHVLNVIKNNPLIKHLRIDRRLQKMIPFI